VPGALRFGKPGERPHPKIFDLEQLADLPSRTIGDDERARFGEALQPGRKVGCLADDATLLRRTRSNQIADHDEATGVLMFAGGLIMTGTLALLSTMLQNLMAYPAMTTGFVTMPRGLGAMAAMFIVAPLIIRVDNRLIIGFGFLLTALSMWQMSQFSLQMGMAPVIISGLLQGFGLGCTQVPLNILALSTLPRHILTQGTAIRSLMRNLGGSIGISVLVANLAEKTQIVHSHLVEGLRPDNPLAQAPYLAAPYSLSTPGGIAALNAEVTRQAAMVAYIDNFRLMMLIALATLPVLLLLRGGRHRPLTAAADD
jgi:DHA2 family multidrug resistance protein